MRIGPYVLMIIVLSPICMVYRQSTHLTRVSLDVDFEISSWLVAYAIPDSSFSSLVDAFSDAKNFVEIAVYEFWSNDILELINSTARRGVKVRILLEGNVYGVEGDEWNRYMLSKLYQLNQSGLPVWIRLEDISGYLHMKVIIIDNSTVVIGSDNYVPTAYPEDPRKIELIPYSTASRGWGVVVNCDEIASYYHNIFSSIFFDADKSHDYDPDIDGTGSEPPSSGVLNYNPKIGRLNISNVPVAPVVSPNNSLDMILWMINRANYTIFIEQMYILSDNEPVAEILDALYRAVDRGVTVQVIVEDNSPGNYYEIYKDLEAHGVHVVRAFSKNSALFMHNKGLIVDDLLVLVGSINWSGSALTQNREAGLLIRSREAALYFREIFAWDWNQSSEDLFDSDGDGLSDIYEREHDYNPHNPDTDGDGIGDWEEVFIYGNKYGGYKPEEIPEILLILLIIVVVVILVVVVVVIIKYPSKRKVLKRAIRKELRRRSR